MGLTIGDDKLVMLDDSHERRVDTSIENNPTFRKKQGLDIYSLYKRKKSQKNDGDGTPLIYALKGIFDYKISKMDREIIMHERAKEIFEKCKPNIKADLVMGVPSSHQISHDISLLLSVWIGVPHLTFEFLEKVRIRDILNAADDCPPVISSPNAAKGYRIALSKFRKMNPDIEFTMKGLEPNIRKYFKPLKALEDVPNLHEKKILIVDDLMSSGTSLICCRDILCELGATVEQGICLLSKT